MLLDCHCLVGGSCGLCCCSCGAALPSSEVKAERKCKEPAVDGPAVLGFQAREFSGQALDGQQQHLDVLSQLQQGMDEAGSTGQHSTAQQGAGQWGVAQHNTGRT